MSPRPLLAVCVLLIVLGTWFRIQDLGFPFDLSFDERHFVRNAERLLAGRPDQNNHPPLGKLLIAGSIRLFGDQSVAWRLPSLLVGLANIPLAGALARRCFRDPLAGWCAAACVAADGFLLAYARTALLDGVLVGGMLATACLVVDLRRARDAALAAVLAGLTTCVKFTGIVLWPALVAGAWLGGLPWRAWGALLLAPVAYAVPYGVGLWMGGKPVEIWADTRRLYAIHAGLTDWENPLTSRWYTWFLPEKPIRMRFARLADGHVRAMTSLGNLVLTWGLPLGWARALLGGDRGPRWLLAFFLLPLVPWWVSDRDSYHYHYLPSYTFGVVLLGGTIGAAARRRPRLALGAMVLVAAVFLAWLPTWAQLPIERDTWRWLMFREAWR